MLAPLRRLPELRGHQWGAETRRAAGCTSFGSFARGEATAGSDIDFLVEFEKGRTLVDLSGLRLDLRDVLGRDVDVATPGSLHPKLRDRILDELISVL
jgi:uncharacterized protein